jgi:hypothetical protein
LDFIIFTPLPEATSVALVDFSTPKKHITNTLALLATFLFLCIARLWEQVVEMEIPSQLDDGG